MLQKIVTRSLQGSKAAIDNILDEAKCYLIILGCGYPLDLL